MLKKIVISPYLLNWQKRTFDIIAGAALLLFVLPLMGVVSFLILITVGWPILFVQDRVGKNGKIFKMYKFRTMRIGAEKEQNRYKPLNEADGPVFKIRNDPRFVGIGKWLSRTGLDELTQLFNVMGGDMSLVGPRPLPVDEDGKLSSKTLSWRHAINPGIMSRWVILGGHRLMLHQWMELDKQYAMTATLREDVLVLVRVLLMQLVSCFTVISLKKNLVNNNHGYQDD